MKLSVKSGFIYKTECKNRDARVWQRCRHLLTSLAPNRIYLFYGAALSIKTVIRAGITLHLEQPDRGVNFAYRN
jgi:hypothetical protein